MISQISSQELQQLHQNCMIIDLMTPEEYATGHLRGALNACSYEMIFLDRVAELVPDVTAKLVIYDATGTTQTATTARDRLVRAGYSDVAILIGGLAAWRDAGLPMEPSGQSTAKEVALHDGTYQIVVEQSTVEWIGRNLNNCHHGRVAISSGEIVVQNGRPAAGIVVVDLTTISNLDITDPPWHDMLLSHLISDDFFSVVRFPTASFRLTGWESQEESVTEASCGIASGELHVKGITLPISFPAIIAPQVDGTIKAHARVDIDRTRWQVNYGSTRLFEHLGMHLVHDLVSLELFVLTRKLS
jgi:rhodanese-related sulfurtransferase